MFRGTLQKVIVPKLLVNIACPLFTLKLPDLVGSGLMIVVDAREMVLAPLQRAVSAATAWEVELRPSLYILWFSNLLCTV